MRTKSQIGPLAIFILALVPAVLWAGMLPLSARFAGYHVSITSLAQLSGLVGISLFALVLILGARLAWLEDFFGGLNKIYTLHHLLGGLAFTLLLLHPLFSAAAFIPSSLVQAAAAISPFSSQPLLLGWLALGTMIILLGLTFYLRPGYQLWKFTHKFLGLAFFLGGLHAFFIPSDIAHNVWLRTYVLGLAAVALTAYTWHSLLNGHKKYVYAVESVQPLHDAICRVVLVSRGDVLRYQAGQFAFFQFIDPSVRGEWHPFSFSSSAGGSRMEITVKALGTYTHSLAYLKPGAMVRVQGPYGRFNFYRGRYKQQVWIAGGIGVTPFISMGQDLRRKAAGAYRVSLLYAVRNRSEAFAWRELAALAKASGGMLQAVPWYSDARGHITARKVAEMIGQDLTGLSFYICGPGLMMSSLREQLVAEGVSKHDIYSEEFEL
jgi:predicted ferric reductase